MLAFLDFVCMCDFQKNNVISCFEKPRAIAIVMANRQTRGMSPDSIVRKLFVEEEEAIEMKTFSDGEYITNLFSKLADPDPGNFFPDLLSWVDKNQDPG